MRFSRYLAIALAIVSLIGISWLPSAPLARAQGVRPEIRTRLWFARPGGIYDPAFYQYTSDWFLYPSMFNYLVRWVPGTEGKDLEPDLAERWTVSRDGKVFTFQLRKGVQFHRGYGEMTADDVVFSFQRQIDDDKTSFHTSLRDIAKIEAVDRYTVRIELKEPDAAFLRTVVAYRPGFIASKAAVQSLKGEFKQRPIGTGPFMMEGVTAGREVVLRSNDQYFRGQPSVSKITFVTITDETVAGLALQRNEIQIGWIRANPEIVARLEQDRNIRSMRVVRPTSLRFVTFNPKRNKALADVRVRRALAYAITKDAIEKLFGGLETPAHVVRPPEVFGGSLDVPQYRYDGNRARQLLTEAGYPNGFGASILYEQIEPHESLAQLLAANWKAIGVDVRLVGQELTRVYDLRERLEFEVAIPCVGRPADPHLQFFELFHSSRVPPGSTLGTTGWTS